MDRRTGRFFQAEDNILLVAKEDGEPAGFLYAYILEAPHALRPKMFLYSIDVFPKFQGRGVGAALIEELKRLAAHRNCSEIFVLTNENNPAANRLYQKTGVLGKTLMMSCMCIPSRKGWNVWTFSSGSAGKLLPIP